MHCDHACGVGYGGPALDREVQKVFVVTEDTFSVMEHELSILGDVAVLPLGFSSANLRWNVEMVLYFTAVIQ